MLEIVHEDKPHGNPDFPYVVYPGKIPDFFLYYPLHWHNEFEFIYVIEGTGYIRVQNIDYLCSPGDIFIIPPNHIHSMYQKGKNFFYVRNILFDIKLLENDHNSAVYKKYFLTYLNPSSVFETYIPDGSEINKKIRPYFDILVQTRFSCYTKDELIIKSSLYAIFYYIKDLIKPLSSAEVIINANVNRLFPLLSYMQKNCKEDISIEKAAAMTNLSESRFMTVFKQITDYSFVEYLNILRVENSVHLLREGSKNISEISEECGFHNLSYFIRTFKKIHNKTPLQYKKELEQMKKNREKEKKLRNEKKAEDNSSVEKKSD